MSYTDTPVYLWTSEQAAQWMEHSVQFPMYKENMIHHNVTGEKLLTLTLRDFDKIGEKKMTSELLVNFLNL